MYAYVNLSMRSQTVCSGMSWWRCALIHRGILGTDQDPPLSIAAARSSKMDVSHRGGPGFLPDGLVVSASRPPALSAPIHIPTRRAEPTSAWAISARFLPSRALRTACSLVLQAASRVCCSAARKAGRGAGAMTMRVGLAMSLFYHGCGSVKGLFREGISSQQ